MAPSDSEGTMALRMALKLLCFLSWSGTVVQAQSRSWQFPGQEKRNYFKVEEIALPDKFTIETWIFPDSQRTPFPADGNDGYWLSYATPNDVNCVQVDTRMLTQNKWQHVHITWDGSSSAIYVDGGLYNGDGLYFLEEDVSGKDCSGNNDGVLVMAQLQTSLAGGFDQNKAPGMQMDTVAIYNTAWTAGEVAAVAGRECIESWDTTLIGAWFDGPDDHSGNGHTAYISAETTHLSARGCCSNHDGACFHGDGTVLLESGSSKRFSEVILGDIIKTSDGEGRFSFNPVLNLPHNANNSEPAAFITLTTETGKMVAMTSDHFIPRCGQGEVTAGELVVCDCLLTVDGKETFIEIEASPKNGVFTAITQDQFIVVNGVVASPYSQISDPREKYEKYLSELKLSSGRKLVGAKGKKKSGFKKSLRP